MGAISWWEQSKTSAAESVSDQTSPFFLASAIARLIKMVMNMFIDRSLNFATLSRSVLISGSRYSVILVFSGGMSSLHVRQPQFILLNYWDVQTLQLYRYITGLNKLQPRSASSVKIQRLNRVTTKTDKNTLKHRWRLSLRSQPKLQKSASKQLISTWLGLQAKPIQMDSKPNQGTI